MVGRLRGCGVSLDEGRLRDEAGSGALGRRNLAEFLVQTGRAGSVRGAFSRYLGDDGRVAVPQGRPAVGEGAAPVRRGGGGASRAPPSYDCDRGSLRELRGLGLGAVEVEYPATRPARRQELRRLAREFDLAVSGGSDCHGPDQLRRAVGACSISAEELEALR